MLYTRICIRWSCIMGRTLLKFIFILYVFVWFQAAKAKNQQIAQVSFTFHKPNTDQSNQNGFLSFTFLSRQCNLYNLSFKYIFILWIYIIWKYKIDHILYELHIVCFSFMCIAFQKKCCHFFQFLSPPWFDFCFFCFAFGFYCRARCCLRWLNYCCCCFMRQRFNTEIMKAISFSTTTLLLLVAVL